MVIVAVLSLLHLASVPPKAPLATGNIEVPFQKTANALIVPAVINGRQVELMFDTGFGGTVVLSSGIDVGKPTGKMTLRDFVGETQADTVNVKSLTLGRQVIDPKDKQIVVQDIGITDSYGVHCDGIMGFEVIKDYIIEFNFENSKLIFHPRSYDITTKTPDNQKTFLCKMLQTGQNSIEMSVTVSTGKKMMLALDTGNSFYSTSHKDVLQRVGLWADDRTAKFQKLSGVASGAVASWYYKMKDVKIWGIPVTESYWDIIDAPSSSADGDGTVGYQFLKNFNITIDYDRRRVWMENFTGKFAEAAPASVGISAGYDDRAKRVRIYLVAPESPADKAGIKAGDFLLSINGVDASGNFEEITKKLEGPDGSKVTLATSRNGILSRNEITRIKLVNES